MRPPEVFVRELSPDEGSRLKSISRKAKYQSKRQRAMIVLASSTGMSAPQIAGLVRSDESHVRKVIHAFNEQGFSSLDPDYRGGRPKKTTPEQRDQIVAVARARPDTLGVALTRWSLAKLSEHLAGLGIELCEEALRQTLRTAGLSHQRTRSWNGARTPSSPTRPSGCSGSIAQSPPTASWSALTRWAPSSSSRITARGGRPRSGPSGCARPTPSPTACATCSAPTTSMPTGCTAGCAATRTPARCSRSTSRSACATTPGYGSTSSPTTSPPDKTPAIREWAETANTELVFTPTYASFLNRIECHFWGIGEFVINNADYPNWENLAKAMADHIRYRNGPHRDERLIAAERKLLIAA